MPPHVHRRYDDPFDDATVYEIEGEFAYDVIDLVANEYVQVQLLGIDSSPWTYYDPSGSLEVDDIVEVPFGYNNQPTVGKVVALGRGSWTGPTKDVTAQMLAVALV